MGVDHPGLKMTFPDLVRLMRKIARQTFQNSSIGRAGFRVYDGGWIRIEDGGLQVTGIASVSGRLEGSGTLDWTGPVNLKGAQSVTGPTTFTGKMTVNGAWEINGNGAIDGSVNITGPLNVLGVWDLTGNGDITGNVNLTGDINVTGGGRIKAGLVVINPSSSGGVIEFGAGEIRGGDGIGLYPGSGPSIITSSAGVRIAYLPTIDSASAGGAVPGTVWCNAMGYLYRVT
ncbi:hypothetical protein PQI51_03165 [Microbacterium esteraromaticum]|uniref:hypothetical protein n=1 Tax=Microbacterium esteraromaticum TaxID=57043 RepID=UPI00309813DC